MIMNRNPRALRAEAARHRRADARRGAGDEHDLAGKVRYNKPRIPRGGVTHFLEIRRRWGAECEGSAAVGQQRRSFVGTHKNPAKNSGARALILGCASLTRLRQRQPDGGRSSRPTKLPTSTLYPCRSGGADPICPSDHEKLRRDALAGMKRTAVA